VIVNADVGILRLEPHSLLHRVESGDRGLFRALPRSLSRGTGTIAKASVGMAVPRTKICFEISFEFKLK
jgi:hypothetical protein